MIFLDVLFLLFCYRLSTAQTEIDQVYNGVESDLVVFDFIYNCVEEYSGNVVSSLRDATYLGEKHQLYEECEFYPALTNCLLPKAGNRYVDQFISSLDTSMGFCQCLSRKLLLSTSRKKLAQASKYCKLCEEQIGCLGPYSENPFIRDALLGLDVAVKSKPCIAVKAEEIERERQRSEKETTPNLLPDGVSTVSPASSTSPEEMDEMNLTCLDHDHQVGMTIRCAVWLYTNYHAAHKGWKRCSSFTRRPYKRKCGHYWAKCKKSGKKHNKSCCISIHCYGGLGK